MADSYNFAVDVFRTVCDRFATMPTDLQMLVETGLPFEEWIVWEAYLACRLQAASYPFCEVAGKPTYASEGVVDEGEDPDSSRGDLRVGGPNDGANHCWLFAEFVLLHDGNSSGDGWQRKIEAAANTLERLGWKRSAALLVVVAASSGETLASLPDWNRPGLTEPFHITLPGWGSVVVEAFDIKRDPADTLTRIQ